MSSTFNHHAYCLYGDRGVCMERVFEVLDAHNYVHLGNPDFVHAEFDAMGVDDARDIIVRQSSKALQGGTKVFVICAHTLTTEAQNALLKVIEEPAPSTQFFLVVPAPERLLPTIRSRVYVYYTNSSAQTTDADRFLKSTYKDRLTYVDKLVKSIKDEKESKEAAYKLCTGLEHACTDSSARRVILETKQALLLRGVSVKHLLEQLALVL